MIRRSLVPPAVPANRHRGHEAALASFHCRGAAGIDPLESGGQIPSGTTSLKGRVARTSGPPPKSLDAGKACHGGRAAVGSCGRGRESRKNLATRGGGGACHGRRSKCIHDIREHAEDMTRVLARLPLCLREGPTRPMFFSPRRECDHGWLSIMGISSISSTPTAVDGWQTHDPAPSSSADFSVLSPGGDAAMGWSGGRGEGRRSGSPCSSAAIPTPPQILLRHTQWHGLDQLNSRAHVWQGKPGSASRRGSLKIGKGAVFVHRQASSSPAFG